VGHNGAMGTVTNGPGSGADGADKDPFCETFIATLHEWCGKPEPRPSFNNMFFKNLKTMFPDIFKNMLREAPVLAWLKNGVLQVARASSVPAAAGALGTLAGALLGAYNPANGPNWSSMRSGMHDAFQAAKEGLGNPKIWDAYPDGMSKDGKTWLEIKRPKDQISKWQKDQHKAFKEKTGKPVDVAGCNCPGANCGGDGNDCPEGYPPAAPI
jgi:hypothetical protein